MKKIMKALMILILLSVTSLLGSEEEGHGAHCNELHGHKYNQSIKSSAIQVIAKDEVKRLVSEKKIAKSWKSVPVAKIGRTHKSYIDDWIVVFENSKIKKKSRKTLYIFVSRKGNIMGVNYTGK